MGLDCGEAVKPLDALLLVAHDPSVTDGTGAFQFDAIATGTYTMVVREAGTGTAKFWRFDLEEIDLLKGLDLDPLVWPGVE